MAHGNLVLARKAGQSIEIGTGETAVSVTVVSMDLQRGEVRLAIEAPREVAVMRRELIVKNLTPTAPQTEPNP